MTFYVEEEVPQNFDFDLTEIGRMVAQQVLESEECPYEAQINFLLTDDDGIHEMNREFRQIDRPTDVLSFPNITYRKPSEFVFDKEEENDCFDPDSGELVFGDIVISRDKIIQQAEEYGHSRKREYAFLIAHSMLHLCGYDHMTEAEAAVMEEKQKKVLDELGITREG